MTNMTDNSEGGLKVRIALQQAEIERLQAETKQLRGLLTNAERAVQKWMDSCADLDAENERLRAELAQTKEAWHNQYTTAMHLSADLAEVKQLLWMRDSEHPMASELNEAEADWRDT